MQHDIGSVLNKAEQVLGVLLAEQLKYETLRNKAKRGLNTDSEHADLRAYFGPASAGPPPDYREAVDQQAAF